MCHLRGGYFLSWYNESNFLVKIIIRLTQKLIDAQIVLGFNLIPLFEPFMDKNKIHVIPNGGNFIYEDLKISKKGKVKILFLGNFIKSKGILDFIHSGINLPKNYKNKLIFQIVGDHVDCENEINDILNSKLNVKFENLGILSGKEKRKNIGKCRYFYFSYVLQK